jgi:hypothetical protein
MATISSAFYNLRVWLSEYLTSLQLRSKDGKLYGGTTIVIKAQIRPPSKQLFGRLIKLAIPALMWSFVTFWMKKNLGELGGVPTVYVNWQGQSTVLVLFVQPIRCR